MRFALNAKAAIWAILCMGLQMASNGGTLLHQLDNGTRFPFADSSTLHPQTMNVSLTWMMGFLGQFSQAEGKALMEVLLSQGPAIHRDSVRQGIWANGGKPMGQHWTLDWDSVESPMELR